MLYLTDGITLNFELLELTIILKKRLSFLVSEIYSIVNYVRYMYMYVYTHILLIESVAEFFINLSYIKFKSKLNVKKTFRTSKLIIFIGILN